MKARLLILVLFIVASMTAVRWAAADGSEGAPARPDTTMPAYLQELARRIVDSDTSAVTTTPAGNPDINSMPFRDVPVFLPAAGMKGAIEPDSLESGQIIVQRVLLRDRDAIAYLHASHPFRSPRADDIEFMEIFDVGRSGFGRGNLVVAHPSGESFLLDNLDEAFLDAAATWTRSLNLSRDRSHTRTVDMPLVVAELSAPVGGGWERTQPEFSSDESERMAIKAIGAGVHRIIGEQYGLSPMELYFSRSDSATTVEIWGFEPDSLRFRYLSEGGDGRTDLLTVAVRDSFVRTYRSYVDFLVIRESRSDTLFAASR